jgi:hypothetical protein
MAIWSNWLKFCSCRERAGFWIWRLEWCTWALQKNCRSALIPKCSDILRYSVENSSTLLEDSSAWDCSSGALIKTYCSLLVSFTQSLKMEMWKQAPSAPVQVLPGRTLRVEQVEPVAKMTFQGTLRRILTGYQVHRDCWDQTCGAGNTTIVFYLLY